ncbi:MAG: glycosyltransferase family 2 protein [Paludibacteraceae bacterium]|nr:glycosyltransferase family 2 protein [Paludibacteraceae bacterium]
MKTVTVIIPCFNEAQSLPLLHAELCRLAEAEPNYVFEFLFINDGSRDHTADELRQLRAKDERCNYVELSRNYGKEVALLAGFDYAKGDCAVVMDADLQHPPQAVHAMLRKWEEGYDDVYARRISRGKEAWLRKRLSLAYYKLLSRSARIDVLPNVGDFRLLDRCCLDALRQLREQSRYTKGMYCYIGFKKTFVDFETQDRVAGQSSMSYRLLFRLAIEGLTAFTTSPLQWATGLGLVVSLVSFVYAIWVGIKTLVWGEPVAGFPTLMITILFLGGVQLLSLGIIGEYLGRVFHETKNRPVYFVQSYNGER